MSRPTARERRVAQIFEFPAMKAVPPPEYSLSEMALAKYLELARRLLSQKKLNEATKRMCEQFALLHQEVERRNSMHQSPSVAMLNKMDKLSKDLGLVEASAERSHAEGKTQNRFARFGIITRRWA